MRHLITILFTVGVLFAAVGRAEAQQPPQTTLHYAAALVLPLSDHGDGLPPLVTQNLLVAYPLSPAWSLVGKAGFATKLSLFEPAPQAQLGASARLSDTLRLGGTIMYRYVPPWGNAKDAHVLGPTVGLAIALSPGLVLNPTLAAARNLSAGTNSVAFATEIVCKLPI